MLAESPIREPEQGKVPENHTIRYEDVSFSYGGPMVLANVSFEAKPGQITALVGPSGSGKSTIAQLIPRFWDVGEGRIMIGGVDIRDMKTTNLMDTISFVFQDSFLFSDTLYQNIAVGKPWAETEEVYAAAKAAQCHEFISGLPEGYDTLIGEGGVYLSGGEMVYFPGLPVKRRCWILRIYGWYGAEWYWFLLFSFFWSARLPMQPITMDMIPVPEDGCVWLNISASCPWAI